MRSWIRSMSRVLHFFLFLFLLLDSGCKRESRYQTRGTEDFQRPHTVGSIFGRVKADRVGDIDPLGRKGNGAIDVSEGQGYYARISEPKEVIDEYQQLADDLKKATPEELGNSEIVKLRDDLVDKLQKRVAEIAGEGTPVMRFYAPFVRVTQRVADRSSTDIAIGPSLFHVDLGIETENIGEEMLTIKKLDEADSTLGKALIWCRNRACQVGNFLTTPKRIVGLKAGVSIGSSISGQGMVALTWKRAKTMEGILDAGKTALEFGVTAFGGMASYTGYIQNIAGRPALRLPAGVNLNMDSTNLLNQAFHAIMESEGSHNGNNSVHEFGEVKGEPFDVNKDYYFGVRKNGTLGAVPVDTSFGPERSHRFWEKRVGLLPMGTNSSEAKPLWVRAMNSDCDP